jgi:hypothetical protein
MFEGDTVYSIPLGRAVPVAEVAAAHAAARASERSYFEFVKKYLPLRVAPVDPWLCAAAEQGVARPLGQFDQQVFADTLPDRAWLTIRDGALTGDNCPPKLKPMLPAVQAVLARLGGGALRKIDMVVFQRNLAARANHTAGGMLHYDRELPDAIRFGSLSFFCNIVSAAAAADAGYQPRDFGLQITDLSKVSFTEFKLLQWAMANNQEPEMPTVKRIRRWVKRMAIGYAELRHKKTALEPNHYYILFDGVPHHAGMPTGAQHIESGKRGALVTTLNLDCRFKP